MKQKLSKIFQVITKIGGNKILLGLILIFALISRGYRIANPSSYYFDEVYHAFTANAYAQNDPRGYEWWHTAPEGVAYEWLHPPVSKLLMGLSIAIFGNVSWAWRLPSVVFGVLTIAALYLFVKTVFKNERLALLVAWVASMDGLLLTQSRIAMNDIFLVFWVLMALSYYWKWQEKEDEKTTSKSWLQKIQTVFKKTPNRYGWYLWLSGIFAGIGVATKWSGVFVIGIIGVWEVAKLGFGIGKKLMSEDTAKNINGWKKFVFYYLGRIGLMAIVFGMLPIVIYFLSYSQWWLQGHTWAQFKELHNQIWWYETNLEATHPYQSQPWQWVLNLKPVWFHVDYSEEGKIGNIYALANPVIAWGGLIGLLWLVFWGVWNEKKEVWWIWLGYVAFWLPWVMAPRIMFFYHYTPAIPFLSIGWAKLIYDSWTSKYWWLKGLGWAALLLTGMMFIYFYPHWTAMLIPSTWAEKYYWFKSWK